MIKRNTSGKRKYSSETPLAFYLDRITTEQFALRPILPEGGEELLIHSQVRFGITHDPQEIACGFYYSMEVRGTPAITLDVVCEFIFSSASWKNLHINGRLKLSTGFAQELSIITSGVARGILHAKTENTKFNQYPITLFRPEQLVDEDVRLT
jgi:hypothetical protein